ncbi:MULTISPECIES: DNA/RNA nuclease SfsA [Acetobacterium]|uniref:Sugar fermentation stimulation protein homolog n=1 Tax=Acetobacterium wieringae TaxID=52694 RepID=A0A1F2PHC3_9FIRM|nr:MULTISPECIES: DNA/RNA nuclease SfsA [Acetobacterium]OFV70728.1 sugar fermentation stimulation protein A [Acetobacterium wieringae]
MKVKLSKYPLVSGIFLSRPNRFIAKVMINQEEIVAHVPNTGRMSELLVSGVRAILAWNPAPHRKTDYTLLLVEKDGHWVSVNSMLANQIAYEFLNAQADVSELKQEVTYGNSRFDLACLKGGEYAYYEVKSVNLVVDQIAMFPDAPTERGSKHLAELLRAHQEGYHAGVIFVVQRNDAKSFQPNKKMDPKFSRLLGQCHSLGIEIRALSCDIDGVNIEMISELPVTVLSEETVKEV